MALTDGLYTHAPSAAPIYTLPAVADGLLHDITIEVLFSAGALSVAFFDAGGNLIPPRDMAGTIAAGKSVVYLCRFAPLKNAWVIMPVMED